jgi:hypothetical protein
MTEEPREPTPLTSRQKKLKSTRRFRFWRRRHQTAIGRLGWFLFLGGIAVVVVYGIVTKLVEWGWLPASISHALDVPGTVAGWSIAAGIVVGFSTLMDSEEKLAQPTSERLKEVMTRFEGLDSLVRDLAGEVQEMTEASLALEKRAKDAEALLHLSRQEKEALLHEWDRRDKAASKRDILFFAAGLLAGVLTNVLLP